MVRLARGHRVLLISTLILIVVLGAVFIWLFTRGAADEVAPAFVHDTAPDFTLVDTGGLPVTLSKTAGTVRVLHFWASWSPYSRSELQLMQEVHNTYGSQVTVLAIGRDTTQQDGERLVAELGLETAPWILFDPSDSYYRQVGGYNMPETVVLDSTGDIISHVHGPVSSDALYATLDQALNTK